MNKSTEFKRIFENKYNCKVSDYQSHWIKDEISLYVNYNGKYFIVCDDSSIENYVDAILNDPYFAGIEVPSYIWEEIADARDEDSDYIIELFRVYRTSNLIKNEIIKNELKRIINLENKQELLIALQIKENSGSAKFYEYLENTNPFLYGCAIVALAKIEYEAVKIELVGDIISNGKDTLCEMQNGVFEFIDYDENINYYIYSIDEVTFKTHTKKI